MIKLYLENFERKLTQELLRLSTEIRELDGKLLETEDINERWNQLASEYLADAVLQVKDYPTVSVGWAGYLGMAIAKEWDTDWNNLKSNSYRSYYGMHGFDDMDENILQNTLNIVLGSDEANQIEEVVRKLAQKTVTIIRAEQIEPQSVTAYHVFMIATKTMYKIGASIWMKRMGYCWKKVN